MRFHHWKVAAGFDERMRIRNRIRVTLAAIAALAAVAGICIAIVGLFRIRSRESRYWTQCVGGVDRDVHCHADASELGQSLAAICVSSARSTWRGWCEPTFKVAPFAVSREFAGWPVAMGIPEWASICAVPHRVISYGILFSFRSTNTRSISGSRGRTIISSPGKRQDSVA